MASRTVKSAAGESVEIVPDEEWIATTGAERQSLRQWAGGVKPWVFRALWEHGEFISENGRAPAAMWGWLKEQFSDLELPAATRVMATFRNPVNAPSIEASINGKRTFNIRLVALPETWHNKLVQDIVEVKPRSNGDTQEAIDAEIRIGLAPAPKPNGAADTETLAELDAATWTDADWDALKLDAPTVYEEPAPLEFQVANQVAMSLLTTVVEIISSGKVDTAGQQRLQGEIDAMQQTLGARLDDLTRLRKQLREAGDLISSLKVERDGLRTRLRQTEHNLHEALKGETAQAVNAEIQKRVDAIMRQPPASPKVD